MTELAIPLGASAWFPSAEYSIVSGQNGQDALLVTGSRRIPLTLEKERSLRRIGRFDSALGATDVTLGAVNIGLGIAELGGALTMALFAPFLAVPALHLFTQGLVNLSVGLSATVMGGIVWEQGRSEKKLSSAIGSVRRGRTAAH